MGNFVHAQALYAEAEELLLYTLYDMVLVFHCTAHW